MKKSRIIGVGHYVPERVVTNFDLMKVMDTTDEWIQERTGIVERRYAKRGEETTTTMATEASKIAIERAGIEANDLDFIIFATLSPDYYFPGGGVLLQRALGIAKTGIGALDIRTQCTGFVYGLSIADQFIKSGMYKNILVVGAEMHSMGLDYSTEGRNITVIFGDGAGAAVLQAVESDQPGILTSNLHSDGRFAEELTFESPGSHGGYYDDDKTKYGFSESEFDSIFVTPKMLEKDMLYPYMNGTLVFKHAVTKFPAAIIEGLEAIGKRPEDIDMLIPHQANLRISQFIQKRLKLSDDKVWNNIQKYGNTTAASIPIALSEAWENGKIKDGDLVCLAAFGSGFTWGAVFLEW